MHRICHFYAKIVKFGLISTPFKWLFGGNSQGGECQENILEEKCP